MAKYTITHTCGHTSELQLFGPMSQREWLIKREEEGMCTACYREWQATQSAKQNKELGLPELKGTEKQIAWAEKIRRQAVEELDRVGRLVPEGTIDQYREGLNLMYGKNHASWWIDHRDKFGYTESILRLVTQVLEEATKKEQDSAPEAIAAKAEATIRPVTPKSELIAEITVGQSSVSVFYPEKDDDLRTIVKGLKYRWSDRAWRRTLTAGQGSAADRAAEVAHHLLAAGFIVQLLNAEAREKAISGQYEPEQTRWIKEQGGSFVFRWSREDDFYLAAKKIPGSWYKPPYVHAPAVQFEQVLDFANRYNFSLSPGAQALAEKAKAEKEAALIVEVEAPRKEKGLAPGTKPPELETPEEVSVDESLRDDD